MTFECAGRSKFAEFMTDHIFGYINGNVLSSVVNGESMTYEFRENSRCTRPSLNYSFFAFCVHILNFFV